MSFSSIGRESGNSHLPHLSDTNIPLPNRTDTPQAPPAHEEANPNTQEQPQSTPEPPENCPVKEATRAEKLAQGIKLRASLLKQLETQTSKPSDQPASVTQFQEKKFLNQGVEATLGVQDKTLETLKVANQLGVNMQEPALSGANYFGMVANEVFAGLSFMGAKWQLRTVKAEREEIRQKIEDLPLNHPSVGVLTAQKFQLDAKIDQLEKSANKSTLKLIGAHLKNSLIAVIEVLGRSTDAAATTAVLSTAGALGTLEVIGGTVGIVGNVLEHRDIENQLVKIERVSEKHENKKVSNAINAVKAAAIDHTANHQKREIEIGIFQSGFTACKGATIAAITLIGAIVGPAAIAAFATAIPIVTGLGLLVAGGVALYQNRHTIGRGLKGLVSPGDRGRLSPHRNLRFRQWRKQVKLQDTVKKLDKLAFEHASLNSSDPKVQQLNEKIEEKAAKVVKLGDEINKIRLDRATQTLRDETGSLSKAAEARSTAISFAVGDIVDEIKVLNEKIKRLDLKAASSETQKQNVKEAYVEFKAKQIQAAEKQLEKIDTEIKKLDEPDDKLIKQFESKYQKEVNDTKDQLRMPDPNNTEEKAKLEAKIAELDGYLNDVPARILAEKERLLGIRDRLKVNIENTKNPKDEMIYSLKADYEKRVEELKENGKALLVKRRDEPKASAKISSAEALVKATSAGLTDSMDSSELEEFVKVCKNSFPGINLDEFSTKHDKHQYVQTQIQRAIAYNSLFKKEK